MNPIEVIQESHIQDIPASDQLATQLTSREIRHEIDLLNQKIVDLQGVAAATRRSELADVIHEVREMLSRFEMTPDELKAAFVIPGDLGKARRSDQTFTGYIGPNGERWAGRRGPKPRWVVDALRIGHQLEEFRVVSVPGLGSEDTSSGPPPGLNRWRPMVTPQP